jgi:hypothetical protein
MLSPLHMEPDLSQQSCILVSIRRGLPPRRTRRQAVLSWPFSEAST